MRVLGREGKPQVQPACSYKAEDTSSRKPQKQPRRGLEVPQTTSGPSSPSPYCVLWVTRWDGSSRCAPGCLTNETWRKTQKKSRRVGDLFIPGMQERQRYLHAGCKAPARHTPPPSHRPRLPGPGSDTTGCRAELVPARQARHCQRAEWPQHERVATFGSWFTYHQPGHSASCCCFRNCPTAYLIRRRKIPETMRGEFHDPRRQKSMCFLLVKILESLRYC